MRNPITITRVNEMWIVTRGVQRLVQSAVDFNFRWKRLNRITVDDKVAFDGHEVSDIIAEIGNGMV